MRAEHELRRFTTDERGLIVVDVHPVYLTLVEHPARVQSGTA